MAKKIGSIKQLIQELETEIASWKEKLAHPDKYWSEKTCRKEIARCEKRLAKEKEALRAFADYEAMKKEPTITEFFDRWEKAAREFETECRNRFLAEFIEFEKRKKALAPDGKYYNLPPADRAQYDKIQKEQYRHLWDVRKHSGDMVTEFNDERFAKALDRYIAVTKENLAYDLYSRIYSLIGKITGTDALSFGMSNFGPVLQGCIYGEKANVVIKTIDAGGYNIQRYHFRVLLTVYDKAGNKLNKNA